VCKDENELYDAVCINNKVVPEIPFVALLKLEATARALSCAKPMALWHTHTHSVYADTVCAQALCAQTLYTQTVCMDTACRLCAQTLYVHRHCVRRHCTHGLCAWTLHADYVRRHFM